MDIILLNASCHSDLTQKCDTISPFSLELLLVRILYHSNRNELGQWDNLISGLSRWRYKVQGFKASLIYIFQGCHGILETQRGEREGLGGGNVQASVQPCCVLMTSLSLPSTVSIVTCPTIKTLSSLHIRSSWKHVQYTDLWVLDSNSATGKSDPEDCKS